jgi:hypothetical protein
MIRGLIQLGPWVPLLLFVAGLALAVCAAFTVSCPAGLVAAGAACWVAEWRVDTERKRPTR